MRRYTDLPKDIRAEMLFSSSDENEYKDLSIRNRGRFYNGYCPDVLEVNRAEGFVDLSRNGIMHSLPQAIFYNEEYLRERGDDENFKVRSAKVKKQRELIEAFFEVPDNVLFDTELELHKTLDSIETEKEALVLMEFYDFDIKRERNPLVRKLARLLLDGDAVKGNLKMISFFVRAILGERTECRISHNVVDKDNSVYHKAISFIVFIKGLSNSEYRAKMDSLEEFFWFLEQWFLPFDCDVDFCIKDTDQTFVLGEQLTLDYNTQL